MHFVYCLAWRGEWVLANAAVLPASTVSNSLFCCSCSTLCLARKICFDWVPDIRTYLSGVCGYVRDGNGLARQPGLYFRWRIVEVSGYFEFVTHSQYVTWSLFWYAFIHIQYLSGSLHAQASRVEVLKTIYLVGNRFALQLTKYGRCCSNCRNSASLL